MSFRLLEKRLVPWRWCFGLFCALAFALPLAFLAGETLSPDRWPGELDLKRLGVAYANTLGLCAGTLLVAMPLGIILAVVVYRTDLPGRAFFKLLIFLGLFVPLPIVLAAWQGLFGVDGLLPLTWWESAPGRPWTAGLPPAIWVHAMAGLPWVVFLAGLALTRVERELEEDALLAGPPRRVLWHVSLPRSKGMLLAAALFLALQASAEITVTDMFQTPTLAEDIYLQFTLGDNRALGRAVWHALPWTAGFGICALACVGRLGRTLPALDDPQPSPLVFPLRRWRWPAALLVALGFVAVAGLPLASLVYKMGRLGRDEWSPAEACHRYGQQWLLHGGAVTLMLTVALAVGALTAALALVSAWLMRGGGRLFGVFLCGLAVAAGILPGTAVGIGLMEFIRNAAPYSEWFEAVFYRPGGPFAIIWVQTLRFWPVALALLWPVVSALPREWQESHRLEGHGPFSELLHLIVPWCRRPLLLAAALATALSLAEVSASYRVESPGWETFARLLFDRLHFGVDGDVASLALVMLTAVLGLGVIAMWLAAPRAGGRSG